ncbi:hypothetical protein GDO81_003757 [Engystomops pustulosus]|uniref:Target of rapamycin complex 2 subunit MAPKAP1 n=1 Tax=Engystomops pustulosus TaxID=76066 RepID=A0AAV6ZZ92_ENGPU|nr:hypothetical protein GDO81_003757 [Engystomops pustulosus]KAG8554318.1 hypothetical protein GDO81_003757 [Engystomops pustulosus]
MAFLDNPLIILAHIRQSHVTSDDTGMCEMVLIDHDVDLEKLYPSSVSGEPVTQAQGNGETQGYVYSQSVDITSSWDFGIRRRSNTAQKLERLRKERQNQIKCKNVQWKDRNTSHSGNIFSSFDNVDSFCLHIAEDDGEVDTDFPPLDSNEPIHKFGFSTLALVEKYSSPNLAAKQSLFVRINAAHGFSLIQVDSTNVMMREILEKALKRRKGSQRNSGPQYRLEKQNQPNVPVDLDSTLESQNSLEFCLVRENSSRGEEPQEEETQIDIATVQDMLSSHHYKSFKVSMIHRLRFTTDVQLGISGEKVEIDPVTNQKASTKFWIKQKPISIDSDLLCACDLAEEKSPSHAMFKLTYLNNHDYKHVYFESDAATVNEIVLKVNYILESRASTARADYFAQKQKKLTRRTSFSFQKEKKPG